MSDILFTRTDERLGEFAVRPVRPAEDTALLHGWLTHPKSAFWLMQEATPEQVEREFREIAAAPSRAAFIGLHRGRPAFLVERYDPAEDLAQVHRSEPGDVGMHFLVAPTDTPLHGFTRAVIGTVMELLFADPWVRRVVVEPDVRNRAVHVLNEAVGFRALRTVSLPGKDALLSTCTRAQFAAAAGHAPEGSAAERGANR
ncbi:GNAT family N-acetyltransferase [Streptomyces sodiiphilus]|uniref:Lysine N-acyltransferase MbtK n=1 Tax=Streptomyces sodiiphilus TaxID=226217 RepID=A0ABN2NQP8_9ACTN